jgi:hypothetical protein
VSDIEQLHSDSGRTLSRVTTAGGSVMAPTKQRRSFRGAAQLAYDSGRAGGYLEEVCAACEAGDKATAQRALRQAINELETARAGLRIGMD